MTTAFEPATEAPAGAHQRSGGPPQAGASIAVFGWRVPVVGPSWHDPRTRLSAVVVTLQVLGQTVLGFKVSIAQILLTLGLCALVDSGVNLCKAGVLAWPSSGLLTGNGIAFILRASGTRHGAWWSLHGIAYFALAALVAMLSKHLIRPGGRHLFNPSNVGIVACLLLIGPARVFPQYLWWGPVGWSGKGWPVLAALAVILAGGAWVLRSVRMVPMAAAFLVTFSAAIAVLAAAGASFVAVWHSGPVSGASYWLNICTSPELAVFVFFMMSDPQTSPRPARSRVIYGIATALVAAGLTALQPTEFGIKLAILSSLTVVCALVPAIERLGSTNRPLAWVPSKRVLSAALRPAVVVAAVIAVAAPADTAALASNTQVVLIERGLTGAHNPQ
ncbi:MAG: hypothetical protein ACRDY0_08535 [Acidimicrobiales bacterium]